MGRSYFENPLDLVYCNFDSGASIALYRLNCPRLFIEWSQIKGKISGHNTVGVSDSVAIVASHLLLEEQFRLEGRFDNLDACYYTRHVIERGYKPWYSQFFEWVLIDRTCAYGTSPERALGFGGIITLLWTIWYFLFGIYNLQHAEVGELVRGWRSLGSRIRDALFFSMNTFIGLGFGDWHSNNEKSGKRSVTVFRGLVALERLLGWLLLALFLVTLGRKWIR
jgi:hypothetical protein